jgi:hypothetical protein
MKVQKALVLVAGIALGVATAARGEPEKPPQGGARILEVQPGATIKLDRGADAGIKERQVFEIFGDTRAYYLPLSGGVPMSVTRSVVAHAVVFQVNPDSSLAHVWDLGNNKLQKDQVAVVNAALNPPPLKPRVIHCTPAPETASPWRKVVPIKLEVEVEPGRHVFYQWTTPSGGTFTGGVEVAPNVFRTTTPEIGWVAGIQDRKYPVNVSIMDSAGESAVFSLVLRSTGAAQERAAHPKLLRTLFEKKTFKGLRDVAFDSKNNMFWLDGSPGGFGHEFLRGMNSDGVDLGQAEVTRGDFAAMAVTSDYFYFLDLKDTCVKRFPRGGALAQALTGDPLKIGESGSGTGRFKNPVDMAVLPDGGVVVLDSDQRCIHRFDGEGRFVYSFGRGGEGEHDLKNPVALATSFDGLVYVLDNGRKRVVVYRNGRPEKDDIEVGTPNEDLSGLGVDDFGSGMAILERNSGSVKIFTLNREGWTGTGRSAHGGADDVATLKKPLRLRMDGARVAYVIDREGDSLTRFDAGSTTFAGRLGGLELSDDVRLAASDYSDVVALDRSKRFALRFDHQGWATARMGDPGDGGELRTPLGVGVANNGFVAVVDAKKHEVESYHEQGGAFDQSYGDAASIPVARYGQMSSEREKFVLVLDDTLGVMDLARGAPVAPFTIQDADSIDFAAFSGKFIAAPNAFGEFWIVDKSGKRVSHISINNMRVAPSIVSKDWKKVTGIAANAAGAVFLCDRKAKAIEVFSGSGTPLNTITDEQLGSPSDVATDDLGHLYVFDDAGSRILELGE